jgi:hypothetical protein
LTASPANGASVVRERGQEEGVLVFLHVPKAAGTTFRWLLRQQYPGGVFPAGNVFSRPDEAFACLARLDLASARAVSSHLTMGMEPHFPPGARLVTVLREPVQRTLSHYSYLFTPPSEGKPRRRIAQGLLPPGVEPPPPGTGLEACLDNPDWLLDNLQTRILCGIVSPYDPLPPDALARAKDNVRDRFSYVGVLERFDEFVALLTLELGWPTLVFRRGRENPDRIVSGQLAPEAARAVEEHNALDLELYDYASRCFAEAVRGAREEVAFETAVLSRGRELLAAGDTPDAYRRGEPEARHLAARAALAVRETELEEARKRVAGLQRASSKLERRAAKLERSLELSFGARWRRRLRLS